MKANSTSKETKTQKKMKNIVIAAGPCAVESEEQITDMAYKISLIRDIAQPYGIDFKLRGGAWKPRTTYLVKNNGSEERVFEGLREIGLEWLKNAGDEYNLPVVTELMSEMDLRYFHSYLNPAKDFIQIGARSFQNFALLWSIGNTDFGVLLKNPQHGIDTDEVKGSLGRLCRNKEIVFCTRGQKRYIHPSASEPSSHQDYISYLLKDQNQHPDARNLNNIEAINILIESLDKNVKFCHDPSHTWGGKSHEMRKKIGEYAIKSITEYNYDWILVEVDDKSKNVKCDKEQALLTTLNGIDWSQTYVEKEPLKEQTPFTLIDIVTEIMRYRVNGEFMSKEDLAKDQKKLQELQWGTSAQKPRYKSTDINKTTKNRNYFKRFL